MWKFTIVAFAHFFSRILLKVFCPSYALYNYTLNMHTNLKRLRTTSLKKQQEEGDRSRMKILRINPNKDLSIKTIESILQAALDLYKSGVIKIKEK